MHIRRSPTCLTGGYLIGRAAPGVPSASSWSRLSPPRHSRCLAFLAFWRTALCRLTAGSLSTLCRRSLATRLSAMGLRFSVFNSRTRIRLTCLAFACPADLPLSRCFLCFSGCPLRSPPPPAAATRRRSTFGNLALHGSCSPSARPLTLRFRSSRSRRRRRRRRAPPSPANPNLPTPTAHTQRLYNRISEQCFNQCVDSFRSKSLTKPEKKCISQCTVKFNKMSERAMMRFAEHQHQFQQDQMAEMQAQ